MTVATDTGWKRRDYLRVCSICGHRWKFSKLRYIGELKWACPDDWQGLTATQISRHNARAKPLTVKAVKHPKPVGAIDIYQLEEAQIFNFVTSTAPFDSPAMSTKSSPTAGAAGIYLANVIIENKRPTAWMATARVSLKVCCDYILSLQYGSPTGPSPSMTVSDVRYGGVTAAGVMSLTDVVYAAPAMVLGYTVLGDARYLDAADRFATFARNMQCADLAATAVTRIVYPASGSPYHTGGFIDTISDPTGTILPRQFISYGYFLYFLALLAGVRGMGATYGTSTSAYFSSSTIASISTIMAELASFLTVGAFDSRTGTKDAGLSSTTPRQSYDPYTAAGTGTGQWHMSNLAAPGSGGTTLVLDEWSNALFGLNAAGLKAAEVATVYSWLMGFSSNPSNQAGTISTKTLRAGSRGTYDPTLAIANSVTVLTSAGALRSPPIDTSGTTYSWDGAGVLAAIQSASNPAAFQRAKDTLSIPRRRDTASIETRYMGPRGTSGLSFQVNFTPNTFLAARVGNYYRYGATHVPQLRGN